MVREETLDPENWDEMKELARRMAEDMVTFHQNIREEPIFKPIPEDVIQYLKQSAPREGLGAEETYQLFLTKILANHGSNYQGPKFWAMVLANSTPFAALADMWRSGLNSASGWPATIDTKVELQVIQWFKEVLNYPRESSGVIVSGGSIANLVGLTVARNAKAGYNVKELGANGKLTFYGSEEMHSSIQRDLETIGVGNGQLRRIPSDENFKIRVDELEKRIGEDKKNGYTPVCVIGNSGSTNTGSFDDFKALSELCIEKDLWLHVDGAFGAWAALSPKYKNLVSGQERADSLSFDLHKWMYMPFGIGCTLVRDADAHYHTFSAHAEYIAHEDRWLVDYGPELSRPFRALKAWMCLKENGFDKYGRLIEQNIDQAKYLEGLIASHPSLELLASVASNVVCFRYVREGVDDKGLDSLNQRIFEAVMNSWAFGIWTTKIGERLALRVCIVNHRTTREDLSQFVDWVLDTGKVFAIK